MRAQHLFFYEAKQPNLTLKTRPKQLLGSFLTAFALPARVFVASWGAHKLTGDKLKAVWTQF
jgi:hypothetical protein